MPGGKVEADRSVNNDYGHLSHISLSVRSCLG